MSGSGCAGGEARKPSEGTSTSSVFSRLHFNFVGGDIAAAHLSYGSETQRHKIHVGRSSDDPIERGKNHGR